LKEIISLWEVVEHIDLVEKFWKNIKWIYWFFGKNAKESVFQDYCSFL